MGVHSRDASRGGDLKSWLWTNICVLAGRLRPLAAAKIGYNWLAKPDFTQFKPF